MPTAAATVRVAMWSGPRNISTAMMRACAEIALSHEASCSVSLENGMACGFGVCLGCAAPVGEVGYQLVCCEGPVFDARQVRWEEIP